MTIHISIQKNLTFKNFQYVMPPFYDDELTQVICVEEPPRYDEYKHTSYFLNENGEIIATFEYEHANIEQLSRYRQNIFIAGNYNEQDVIYIVRVENNGKHTILGEYDYIEYGEENFTFAVRKNGKYGFINLDGELIVECMYDSYTSFVNGVAIVELNGKWGVIDKENNIVLPFIYSDELYKSKYGESCHWKDDDGNLTYVSIVEDNKYGLVSKTGELLIPCKYDDITPIDNDLIIAKLNNKFGLIDVNDSVIVPFIYDDMDGTETDNLCMIQKGDLYGLIDKKGNIVYPLGKERIDSLPYDGMYKICEYNEDKIKWHRKIGFINDKGEMAIPIKYHDYYKHKHFLNGYCVVQNEQEQNLIINKKNEIILKNEYKCEYNNYTHYGRIENLGYGLFLVETANWEYKLYKVEE